MASKAHNVANIAAYSASPALLFEDMPTLVEVTESLAQDEDLFFASFRMPQESSLQFSKK